MGILGFVGKLVAVGVALAAILVGLLLSGAIEKTGAFRALDQFEGSRGFFFKGMFPALHEGAPWGFTHDQMSALDLSGETHLVTGANVGLGYWTARHLAASGAHVIMGCRSQGKCTKAAADILADTGRKVETAVLDLASFASIRACAASIKESHDKIDGLTLNAGIMVPPFYLTEDGLEGQIGTNHFGHHLLTKLLLPLLEKAAKTSPATVVAVSSAAHFDSYPEGIKESVEAMNDESAYNRGKAYGQSKLANVLFAQELAERVKGSNILVNSIHPGGVDTELIRHAFDAINSIPGAQAVGLTKVVGQLMTMLTWHPRDAALTQLYAAVGPVLKKRRITGKYFHPIARLTPPDHHASGEAGKKLQKRLWKMTEDFIASH